MVVVRASRIVAMASLVVGEHLDRGELQRVHLVHWNMLTDLSVCRALSVCWVGLRYNLHTCSRIERSGAHYSVSIRRE